MPAPGIGIVITLIFLALYILLIGYEAWFLQEQELSPSQ